MYYDWRVGVVIPARNEEDFIGGVLDNIPDYVDHVIVINDGSTDSTEKIANQYADEEYQLSIIQNNGQGVGSSIDRGHRELLEISEKPFISVVMAGDGQMNPDDMELLLQPIHRLFNLEQILSMRSPSRQLQIYQICICGI